MKEFAQGHTYLAQLCSFWGECKEGLTLENIIILLNILIYQKEKSQGHFDIYSKTVKIIQFRFLGGEKSQ